MQLTVMLNYKIIVNIVKKYSKNNYTWTVSVEQYLKYFLCTFFFKSPKFQNYYQILVLITHKKRWYSTNFEIKCTQLWNICPQIQFKNFAKHFEESNSGYSPPLSCSISAREECPLRTSTEIIWETSSAKMLMKHWEYMSLFYFSINP